MKSPEPFEMHKLIQDTVREGAGSAGNPCLSGVAAEEHSE